MYFYSLSVNYNYRSPTVGNDSQSGIHCCRRITIIYEQTIHSDEQYYSLVLFLINHNMVV